MGKLEKENEVLNTDENTLVLDKIDKERNILAKSKVLKLSNLSNKMTTVQNAIFSLALLNAKIVGNSVFTEFPVSDIVEITGSSTYKNFINRLILKDKQAVAKSSIELIDEEMFNNSANGVATTIMIFSYFTYKRGKFIGVFNTNPDQDGNTYILDILRSREVNPLLYNLKVFSKLSSAGQMLYEDLLILSSKGIRTTQYTIEQLKVLFKANGKTMDRFYTLNQKHLKGAVEEINKFTDIELVVKQIKEGRAVVGVELVWSIDKVKLQATPNQRKTLDELFVQLNKLNPVEKEDLSLLHKLENSHLLSKQEAQGLISKAIGRVGNLASGQDIKQLNSVENEIIVDLNKVREMFPKVTKKAQELLIKAIQNFAKEEQEEILDYAMVIAKQNNARNVNYLITLLNEWIIEEVQTKDQAVALHDQNYGETLPDMESIELSEDFMNAMDLWKES